MSNTQNPIELLVSIKADTAGSHADIQKDLDKLSKQLKGLDVGIKIGEGNKDLQETSRILGKISGTDLSKLQNSVKKLGEGMKGVGASAKPAADGMVTTFTEAQKKIEATFGHLSSNFKRTMKNGVADIDGLKQAFKGMDAKFTMDTKSLGLDSNGQAIKQITGITAEYKNLQGQIERVKFANKEFIDMGNGVTKPLWLPEKDIKVVDSTMKEIGKSTKDATTELNKLHSTGKITTEQFKELSQQSQKFGNTSDISLYNQKLNEFTNATKLASQTQKTQEADEKKLQLTRQRTLDQLERMSQAGRLPQPQATAFADTAKITTSVTEMERLRQSIALTSQEYGKASQETNKQSTAMTNLNHRIQDLVISQKLSSVEAEKWSSKYNTSTASTRIKEVNRELTVHLNQQTQVNNKLKEQAALQEQVRKLSNSIIAEQGKNPKAFGNNVEVNNMLTTLRGIDPASKSAATAVKGVSDGFGKLKAEATEAGRSSMSVMESFKIAMEKFPIWMASSTIFFGLIRTSREFMSIIIDIDTKMTSLKKVMQNDTDFEGVFNRATLSAEKFGQSISEVMDSYVEFAKQGFKGDELGMLADSAVVASNVGDITAQKASEYMTSALVQWKLDAKESMGIIDSWNNISNKYATTTEKLAQGQA